MASILIIILTALALLGWIRALPAVRGSTLLGPWLWWLVALIAIAVYGSAAQFSSTASDQFQSHRPLAFLAAVTLLGPTISLLGAKRPQHQAWHFVVGSLWCVLALPGLEAALLRPHEGVSVQTIRGWFLWILIAAELVNRLGTRMWLVGLMHAGAAIVLLAPHLPLMNSFEGGSWNWPAALALELCAVNLFAHLLLRSSKGRSWNRLWQDYRDRYGLLWSLRVAERMNAAAQMYNWPVRLGWSGFRSASGSESSEALLVDHAQRAAFQQTFVNLLRRFESDEFIQARQP